MSKRTVRNGVRAAAVAAAAMALAGCAADHVGEDWQCPLAQGSVCVSVAAADPAVPEAPEPEMRGPAMLLPAGRDATDRPGAAAVYRPRTEGAAGSGKADDDPVSTGSADTAVAQNSGAASVETAETPATEISGVALVDTAAKDVGDMPPTGAGAEDGDADAPLSAHDGGANEEMRAPETIARVWIGPWVDEDGIYREGAWVRAVIAPAEWRLR